MSWYAYLVDDRGRVEHEVNFTHNCNGMAKIAAEEAGVEFPADTRECWSLPMVHGKLTHYPNGHETVSWWEHLNDMTGPDGAAYLDKIIRGLEANPDRFRAMNPENGWGDYDTFLKVLHDMRDAVPKSPTSWKTSG